jgi:hypothetical protein
MKRGGTSAYERLPDDSPLREEGNEDCGKVDKRNDAHHYLFGRRKPDRPR